MAATAALASPAGAAVSGSHVVAVLPATQGLELSGYPLNDTLNVHVIRNGVVIGSATGTTTPDKVNPNLGDLNIAGGAPPCWTGSTPQILPGDEVTVDDGGAGVDSTIVQNVGATSLERDPVTGHVLVHGFAIAPGGGEYDPTTFTNSIQARITIAAGQHFANQRNNVRAGAGKVDGTISYDAPTANDRAPTTWTADFPLSDFDAQLALGSKDFEGVFTVGVSELTIGRQPPGASGCPAPAMTAVTSIPAFVNASSANSPIKIAGVADAANVSAVSVAVNGRSYGATPAADGTWSLTVPANDVAVLPEGANQVTATYTAVSPGGAGAPPEFHTIVRDTVAPDLPTATPPPASYSSAQSVSLGDADTTATIHYTTGGGTPATAYHPGSPISVTASQTIRATATDPAGNTSAVASFAYTITAPPAPAVGGGAGGGGGGSAAPPAAPATVIQQIPSAVPVLPAQSVQGTSASSSSPSSSPSSPSSPSAAPAAPAARPGVRGLRVGVSGRALRVSLRLSRGANVRFRVFGARNGRATGRALVTIVRPSAASGSYTLRGAALRRLRRGRYVLVADAGGAAASVAFGLR